MECRIDLWQLRSTTTTSPGATAVCALIRAGEPPKSDKELKTFARCEEIEAREAILVDDDPWKDQSMSVLTHAQFNYPDDDSPRRSLWLGESSDELWLMRLSRDRHRTDVFVADASTGAVLRTVVADRMNTYMETRSPTLLEDGDLLWWSEIDGWAHLYRYAPDRDEPQLRWVSWGAVIATIVWVIASLGFSFFVSQFGNYQETYGALAGVIILMLWFFITGFVVLLGAELNSEMEHQTARDTTTGEERPMGERDAVKADTIPEES